MFLLNWKIPEIGWETDLFVTHQTYLPSLYLLLLLHSITLQI
jgi:hypothetical protein